jgi:chromosomal replication initiation ATPase DnaA
MLLFSPAAVTLEVTGLAVTGVGLGDNLEGRDQILRTRAEMTITIDLKPDEERWLSERAARNGEDVGSYIQRLIAREIQAPARTLEEVLAPVRQQFEESGMTDEELAALVEEVREDIWQEEHGRPSKGS